jgi:hypothetical protein
MSVIENKFQNRQKFTGLVVHSADVESSRPLVESCLTCQCVSFYEQHDKCIPFPVTVIGVNVEEAREAKTGVPAAATPVAKKAAATAKVLPVFIFE